MKYNRYLWQVILVLILAAILISCSTTLKTGKYIVEDARGHTIELKGVSGMWRFPTDTLRIGDTVFVKRVFREKDANVW